MLVATMCLLAPRRTPLQQLGWAIRMPWCSFIATVCLMRLSSFQQPHAWHHDCSHAMFDAALFVLAVACVILLSWLAARHRACNLVVLCEVDEAGKTHRKMYCSTVIEDQGKMFDTLTDLRDDKEAANTKLLGLNALITQAEEEIETKEAQIEAMNRAIFIVQCMGVKLSWIAVKTDKMKLWFTRAHTEEHSFFVVIRDFCFELRVTLSQNRGLIAELKALGQHGDALKALEGLREIVAHNVVKLGVLEQLLAATRVGIPLKAGYVADMEDKE
ncbi:hypothetical protein Tco_1042841 [Tanacetum coccineum]|uniref:Uncharacterized protein n=1 Tax=Tanacetum coccineum TaxID=301880 RepID=A0ABQ5GKH6_9ASTR